MIELPGWDPSAPSVLIDSAEVKRCVHRHPRVPSNVAPSGACRRCSTLRTRTGKARRSNAPFCERNHPLLGDGVTADGRCEECVLHWGDDVSAIPPPAEWLDWALVAQALRGGELPRPLTAYEVLTAITTVRRRNAWGLPQVAAWLRAETSVLVPGDDGNHLVYTWARKRGLPTLTLAEAIGYQNVPDAYLSALAGEPYEVALDPAEGAA